MGDLGGQRTGAEELIIVGINSIMAAYLKIWETFTTTMMFVKYFNGWFSLSPTNRLIDTS